MQAIEVAGQRVRVAVHAGRLVAHASDVFAALGRKMSSGAAPHLKSYTDQEKAAVPRSVFGMAQRGSPWWALTAAGVRRACRVKGREVRLGVNLSGRVALQNAFIAASAAFSNI